MQVEPKSDAEPQAGGAVDPQAGKTGAAGAGDPQAGEPISLEKARELRSENKSLRDRLKALEEKESQRDEEARKAAEQKAKEEGRLADVLKARDEEIATLKPKADLAAKLEGLFVAQFEAESTDWPDEVKAMVPDGLEARIDAMPKLRAVVAKFSTAAPPMPGNGRPPKPAGAPDSAKVAEGVREQLMRKGGYSF